MPQALPSPVPIEASTELQRVVERWSQLPLDRALSYAGRVRALVQSLADAVAETNGMPVSAVPDLGPATLMDQLTVMVHDASAAASTATAGARAAAREDSGAGAGAVAATLADDLASLRRELV